MDAQVLRIPFQSVGQMDYASLHIALEKKVESPGNLRLDGLLSLYSSVPLEIPPSLHQIPDQTTHENDQCA